ncbi:hypothetical protein AN403_5445 [Pseudomonas fluorescens]|uniref:Uncharacterized protein n=1 Tax=Pseudomonas fluorescens TaxID=294 RepID=A0A0P8XLV7_PSEFL|nr:hypothetical protein AN403_5445 [Pseudomonas fluorescens]
MKGSRVERPHPENSSIIPKSIDSSHYTIN